MKTAVPLLICLLIVLGCRQSQTKPRVATPTQAVSPNTQIKRNQAEMKKEWLGKSWPLSVENGVVECRTAGTNKEIIFTAGGKAYAVNGIAISSRKYLPIDEIWLDNPEVKGTKISLTSIIDKGLILCD